MFRLRQNAPTPFYGFTVGIKRRNRKLRLSVCESAQIDVHTDWVDTYKLQRLKCPELLDDLRRLGCLFPRGLGKARLHIIVVWSAFLFPRCYKTAERRLGPWARLVVRHVVSEPAKIPVAGHYHRALAIKLSLPELADIYAWRRESHLLIRRAPYSVNLKGANSFREPVHEFPTIHIATRKAVRTNAI